MWGRFLLLSIILIGVDYAILSYFDAYLFKYFIILHFIFLLINVNIIFLYKYLEKRHSDYVGLGIMSGLILKMLFSLGIFVVLYNKLQLNDIQVVNFLFVYFCYTILFLISVLKSGKLKK